METGCDQARTGSPKNWIDASALDTDKDGVPNWEEWIDGTDPSDPSDARAWHPYDMPEFPRLVADQQRWDDVLVKVQNSVEPYLTYYQAAISRAESQPATPQGYDYDPYAVLTNARIARAAAVKFWGGGNVDYAQKASEILRNTDPHFEAWTYETIDKGGILVSKALILLCQTYEILWVTEGFAVGESEQAEAVLQQLGVSFHYYYTDLFPLWFMGTRNNHNIKFDASLGYLALTINDWDQAAGLANFGLTETIHWQLVVQNCPDMGCCPEGPNYLSYSSSNYLPFLIAYHRFADGQSYPYKTSCDNHLWPYCREKVYEYEDPLTDQRFLNLHDWWIHLRMPDGYGPPLGDANLHCLATGVLAAMTGDGRYLWVHENGPRCVHYTGGLSWEQLLLWDDVPELVSLGEEDEFYINPQAGQAVLRSGWDSEARYLLLNAENGQALRQGMGHEQPDNTSYMMMAYEEYFLIDSGYISYDERRRVAGPENHNLILVDGKGPSRGINGIWADNPAFIVDWNREAQVAWAVAEGNWAKADFRRFAALVDDTYFVIVDWINGVGAHDYEWLAHTHAGGTTDGLFIPHANGALLERPQASMNLAVHSVPDPSGLYTEDDEHGFGHGGIKEHTVLHVLTQGEDPVFLALFMPQPGGAEEEIIWWTGADGDTVVVAMEQAEKITLWAAAREGSIIDSTGINLFLPGVRSDAEVVMVELEPISFEPLGSWRKGGTYLEVGGTP